MKELIAGAYDLHVHSGPDLLPRRMDDLEMAQRVIDSGMAGYAIKSHYFCTSERAQLVNKLYPGCQAIGTITLNSSVGGINPTAMEMAGRSGVKKVWFPTCDGKNEREKVMSGVYKKMPYWGEIVLQLQEEGITVPTISILEDGKLIDECFDVLDIIAKYDIILATSHMSHEETFALVKAAKERGVKKMVITHVDFPGTFYTIEEQLELSKYGAFMEHCYTTFATGKVDFEVTLAQIKALGSERVILSTDLGQKTAKYPDEGLLEFAMKLYENGFSEKEIQEMTTKNTRWLLGK